MGLKTLQSLVGHNSKGDREPDDFYETPRTAVLDLLDREKFDGGIWEPACGNGAICKVLAERGYGDITASDKEERGYGEGGVDFLAPMGLMDDKRKFLRPNIITNPPFKFSTEFTERALQLAAGKVAMFNKLSFLEGSGRRKRIFSQGRLRRVYVFSARQNCFKPGRTETSGMLAFAWFVFDGQKDGPPPELHWI